MNHTHLFFGATTLVRYRTVNFREITELNA
jgi:hypothetical protein